MNQNFQKFTCTPQLAYYVCSFLCMTWELIETPENFVQGSFSKKTLKLCLKIRVEVLTSGHF